MARAVASLSRAFLRVVIILAFLAAWQALTSLALVNRTIVPPPGQVASKIVTLFFQPKLFESLLLTLEEVGIALGISLALGIPAGAAMAASPRFASLVAPYVTLLLAAPMVSFIPLIVMVTGISMWSVIAVGVLASIALVAVNTRAGVENIDPLLRTVARTFGHGWLATFFKLTLPGALPYIVVGVRLAAGRAILGVVVGEFFAGTAGLAYRAAEFQNFLQMDALYATVFWLATLGVVINLGASVIEAKLSRWRTA